MENIITKKDEKIQQKKTLKINSKKHEIKNYFFIILSARWRFIKDNFFNFRLESIAFGDGLNFIIIKNNWLCDDERIIFESLFVFSSTSCN